MLSVYRALFRVAFATQAQYRVSGVIWLIGAVLQPVMYLAVWSTVARSGGGTVEGYTAAAFAGYFIVLMLVNHAGDTWVIWVFEPRVRQGQLSAMLLRPLHPIHADIAEHVTHKVIQLVVLLPVTAALVAVFRPALHPSPWEAAACAPALALAVVLRFTVEWTVALLAFWITRVAATGEAYWTVLLFLSGQIAPLSLLPGPVQTAATLLPFRWMVAFPVELALGRLNGGQALLGLAVQAAWVVTSLMLLRILWRTGLRRYSAVGA